MQVKFDVSYGLCRQPDPDAAVAQFEAIKRGDDPADRLALGRYVADKALTYLHDIDLVSPPSTPASGTTSAIKARSICSRSWPRTRR